VAGDLPSIAVLPFVNLSADPEQEYFCDGMAEELINALTRSKHLRVIARTSSFSFKGRNEDVREIGRQLNVQNLLEGSVRKAGNRLRVSAQLVRTADGSHAWSDRFDRELADVLAIQDEIADAIARELQVKLASGERTESSGRQIDNVEAYNLYLTGRFFWNRQTPGELREAIGYFTRAIEIEPRLAVAYAGLADCYSVLVQAWQIEPAEGFPKARSLAQKALEIDNSIAEAHTSLALVRFQFDWDWFAAAQAFETALQLNPGYVTAIHWHALFKASMGHRDEALTAIRRARDLDPLSLILMVWSAWIHLTYGDQDEAAELCRIALERDPSFSWAHIPLAWLYTLRGMHGKAIEKYLAMERDFEPIGADVVEVLRETYEKSGWDAYWLHHVEILQQRRKTKFIPASAIATDYVRIGDFDRAFQWLEIALRERDPELSYLRVQPILKLLERDRRFQVLLTRAGLKGDDQP
jgi:TolB-like protein